MRLSDRVIVVTGAAGTIGSEVARVLAAQGARLAVTDMVEGPLSAIMAEVGQTGATVWGQAWTRLTSRLSLASSPAPPRRWGR